MDKNKVLTVKEVAEELRVATNTAYNAVASGQLPAVRVGRRILISRQALDRFLEASARA